MHESEVDPSRRRALRTLGAAGLVGATGCTTTGPAGADTPVFMDGHVHITHRIYWEKIDPWMPHDGGWDYARAKASGVNCVIDNIGTYGYWNYNYTPKQALRLIETFRGELTAANGSVVNMLDVLAERPMPSFANYSASKAALWNATLSLARTLSPAVRVNGIAPGVVEWNDQTAEADREAYVKKVPLKRIGTPEEVATLVKFLAVDATFITGQIIRIDGGRSLL